MAVGDAVLIVKLGRTIYGQADQEVVGTEKLAPFIVEECAVGL